MTANPIHFRGERATQYRRTAQSPINPPLEAFSATMRATQNRGIATVNSTLRMPRVSAEIEK